MPREFYSISATNLPGVIQQLNTIFSRLTVNLQRIEGLDSATPNFFSNINMNSQKITSQAAGTASDDSANIDNIQSFTGDITITGSMTVDNLKLDGNDLSSTTGNITITPAAGSAIVLDGLISVDGGVITGVTSLTATTFVGALTGNADSATTAISATTAVSAESAFQAQQAYFAVKAQQADIAKRAANFNVAGDLEHTGTNVGFFSTSPTTQATHITDASTSHAVTTFGETDTALDALGTKINSILLVLERHGLIADS